jgi:hypothetical protein
MFSYEREVLRFPGVAVVYRGESNTIRGCQFAKAVDMMEALHAKYVSD